MHFVCILVLFMSIIIPDDLQPHIHPESKSGRLIHTHDLDIFIRSCQLKLPSIFAIDNNDLTDKRASLSALWGKAVRYQNLQIEEPFHEILKHGLIPHDSFREDFTDLALLYAQIEGDAPKRASILEGFKDFEACTDGGHTHEHSVLNKVYGANGTLFLGDEFITAAEGDISYIPPRQLHDASWRHGYDPRFTLAVY